MVLLSAFNALDQQTANSNFYILREAPMEQTEQGTELLTLATAERKVWYRNARSLSGSTASKHGT